MISRIKRIMEMSRGKKLALYVVLFLLTLFVVWILLDCPSLTRQAAFRRAVADNGYPKGDPELLMQFERKFSDGMVSWSVGIRTDGNWTYGVELEQDVGWHTRESVWRIPVIDGVAFTPFGHVLRYSAGDGDYDIPLFAIKAEGADAALTLHLEEFSEDDSVSKYSYPLELQEMQNGWFVFGLNEEDRKGIWENTYKLDYHDEITDSEAALYDWATHISSYYYYIWAFDSDTRTQLELTTWDGAGNVIKQVTWELPQKLRWAA